MKSLYLNLLIIFIFAITTIADILVITTIADKGVLDPIGWILIPIAVMGLIIIAGLVLLSIRYVAARQEAARLREALLDQERESREQLEQTNAELIHSKNTADAANRAKSQFLTNMSHEIRTLMNTILGYTQLLGNRNDLTTDAQSDIQTLETGGRYLLELINDLLDLSKIEAGRMKLHHIGFDLTHLIQEISNMYALQCKQKGLDWRVEWILEDQVIRQPDRRILVRSDEGKLRQVLINLLGNAVKFTHSGEVLLRIKHHGSHFIFNVIDTGIGIPPDALSQIFEPFTQVERSEMSDPSDVERSEILYNRIERNDIPNETQPIGREVGTGIGLALAYQLVELWGGEFRVKSKVSQGSRFWFTMPYQTVTEPVPLSAAKTERKVVRLAPGYSVKALIINDSTARPSDANPTQTRSILARMLSNIGVEVTILTDSQQQMEFAPKDRPDIVFVDVQMPGIEHLEAVRQTDREQMKMVVVSASAMTHQMEACLSIGFDAFISKPVLIEELCSCLAKLLHVELLYQTEAEELDVSKVALPEMLLESLKESARFGEFTNLQDSLDEVRKHGDAAQQLADRLLELIRTFELSEILSLLARVERSL